MQRAYRQAGARSAANLAFTPRTYRAELATARSRFNRILKEEEKKTGVPVPQSVKRRWIVGKDFGTLRGVWKRVQGDSRIDLAGDIIALQDMRSGRKTAAPTYFRTEKQVADEMMAPNEAHALPAFSRDGQHVATIVHVGPKASQTQMRALARALIKDPTARSVPSF